ncbi:WG repeat-containing protein [Pedobacter sp. CCM 8938]|uniref:WG repeat-containing protein n=1 Tax=Pedobacter fastidiosus TaxID=2765361 RepID=A0ABR7KLQ8_9SPHI|nr:WG repeat-containing protein [Pedobacter fastidiosus]
MKGKIIINPQFAIASAFRDGLALVKTFGVNGKWGFIAESGHFTINPIFTQATVFQEGIAWVTTENSAPMAIDAKGTTKFTLPQAEEVHNFSEGMAAFSQKDSSETKWGFIDKTGKEIIHIQFSEVSKFSNGFCAVKNTLGKWGYINNAGQIVINCQFDEAQVFLGKKAVVKTGDKYGVIDENGKYLTNPQFDFAISDGDKLLVISDKKFGWTDFNGKYLINPQFDDIRLFGEEKLTAVKGSEKWGYIDVEGKFIVNPQFDMASSFFNGLSVVKSGDKFGLIDKNGKFVVNPQFDSISDDFFAFLFNNTNYSSILSEYVDVQNILKVINVTDPEKLSLNDSFVSIVKKMNKKIGDFNYSNYFHELFSEKKIDQNSTYNFSVVGKLKAIDYNTYTEYITTDRPDGFLYQFNLINRAYGKAELLKKEFEKKLSAYVLVKKGYVDSEYTAVYKSSKNIIIITSKDTSHPYIYLLKNGFDLTAYLSKIETQLTKTIERDYSSDTTLTDSSTIVTDTTAVDTTVSDY